MLNPANPKLKGSKMVLCSDYHEEVCYEGRNCPVCEMRDSMQDSINDLLKEVESLKIERDEAYDKGFEDCAEAEARDD